jgi:antitoxin component YwqK of YwqJK toxin-antitoxin module
MNRNSCFLLASVAISLIACSKENDQKNIVSQRYIHKYGYDVPRDEWESQNYPGQIITTKLGGISVITSYEDGELHGSKTETYPHSQTIRIEEQYSRGHLKKRTEYNIRGIKQKEEEFLGPEHFIATTWYPNGTPKSREEFSFDHLIAGQYFNMSNELDSRIDNGSGEKVTRNQNGDILAKEVYNLGEITYVETYYPNNTPHTVTSFHKGQLHGDKKIFSISGEPLAVEKWQNGKLHGVATYYQNGCKYKEVPYVQGFKQGTERQYLDGDLLIEELQWDGNVRHGPSIVYYDGVARTTWFFEGEKVSRKKFDVLAQRNAYITAMNQ